MEFNNVVYALLAGILPSLLWLWFWLHEDNLHPEPRTLLAICFIGGAVVVIVAIILEEAARNLFASTHYRYIAWAAIEEIVKFGAVLILALRSKYIDEPIDAMIYCITAALGFAALENALFIFSPIDAGNVTKTLITGNLRFVGATLVHVVCSAIIGFAYGIAFYKTKLKRILSVTVGVILAIALHASFNLAIISVTVTDTLKVFGWVWCAVVILIILFEEVKGIKSKTA